MPQISIGQLPPQEWKKYKEIRLLSLQNEPTAFSSTYEDVAKEENKQWKERLVNSNKKESSIVLFAKDGKKIIGMIAGFWDKRKKIKHIAHIYGTYVDPKYRNQGIGEKLMHSIISELKNIKQIKKIKTEVNAKNIPAYNLYKKNGFRIIGKAEKELCVNDEFYDVVLMEQLI